MKKDITVLVVFALLTTFPMAASVGFPFSQDYFMTLARIRSAETLFGQKNYAKAQEAFEELAAETVDPVEKSKFMARAAVALGRQEGEDDRGIERAQAIELRPYSVYAQMQLMYENKHYEQIIRMFNDEAVTEWPEYEVPAINYRRWLTSPQNVKVYVYRARGVAFHETGNGEAADQDLRRAADLCEGNSSGDHALKLDILAALSRNAAQLLDDETKAMEAQRRIVREANGLRGDARYMQVVVSVAARLRRQGEFDEALDVLSHANLLNRRPADSWFGTGHLAYGHVYAAMAQTQRSEAQKLEQAGQNSQAGVLLEKAGQNRAQAQAHFKTLAGAAKAREAHRKAAEEALKEMMENNG